jgi:hypothetical protein
VARDAQAEKRPREHEAETKSPAVPPPGPSAVEAVEIDDSPDQNINLSRSVG